MPSSTVRAGKAKPDGLSTDTYPVDQKDDFDIPMDDPFATQAPDIIITPEAAFKEQADNLAFAQEPVEIFIQLSNEEHGEAFAPCWNQGKGAEIFDRATRRWQEVGALPRGVNVITRRKYVETILKSKTQDVRTNVENIPGKDTQNRLSYRTTMNYPLMIVTDKNPRGKHWFEAMVRSRG